MVVKSKQASYVLLGLSTVLFGCGGENSGLPSQKQINEDNSGGNETYSNPPLITRLAKSSDLTSGNTISAISVCENCDPSKTVYQWVIDSNGNSIFGDSITVDGVLVKDREVEADQISILDSEVGAKIKLSAQAASPNGRVYSASEYNIYKRRFLVDAVGTYGGFWALLNTGDIVRLGVYDNNHGGDQLDIEDKFVTIGSAWEWYNYAITEAGKLIYSGPYISSHGVTGIDADVTSVVGNRGAAAALKSTGEVVTFGSDSYGGIVPASIEAELYDITKVVAGDYSFTALRKDGKVFSWGNTDIGSITTTDNSNIKDIFANEVAFAALKNDGSVVTWGYSKLDYPSNGEGTGSDSSSVDFLSGGGVKTIIASRFAFAAIKQDDSVVTWGNAPYGGDSSSVDFSSGVSNIVAIPKAFTALKKNGEVVSWGAVPPVPSIANVKEIYATKSSTGSSYDSGAFTALIDDGTVIAWGSAPDGGDINQRTSTLVNNDITSVKPAWKSFLALTDEGTKGGWGEYSPSVNTEVENTYTSYFQFMTQFKDKSVLVEGGNWWRPTELSELDPIDLLLESSL
ncbi:RCC1 domain-containing protein [Vibrio sp. TRT 21S02]|uniref:RCC1 domain-containing protein n=1 Tax=Vibrio sp. TRT 21S02 TaxID=3418507 RepID=UPI003CE8205F